MLRDTGRLSQFAFDKITYGNPVAPAGRDLGLGAVTCSAITG